MTYSMLQSHGRMTSSSRSVCQQTQKFQSVHVSRCSATIQSSRRNSSRGFARCRAASAAEALQDIIPVKWPVVVPKTDVVSVADGMYTVAGEAIVPSSLSLIMAILNDHDNSSRVYSNVESSFSSITDDGSCLVTQVIRWKVLLFSGTFDYKLNVAHDPVENTVIFKMLSSTFMSACEGTWKLIPVGLDEPFESSSSSDGSSSSNSSSTTSYGLALKNASSLEQPSTLIKHTLSVRLAMVIPDAITRQVAPIFQKQVHQVMEDLLKEIQRQEMERRQLAKAEALLQSAVPL